MNYQIYIKNYQDNSTNFKIAQGFSYHNGPEWVWIYGYFLQAMTNMKKLSKAHFYSYLSNHKRFIFDNEWYLIIYIYIIIGIPYQK